MPCDDNQITSTMTALNWAISRDDSCIMMSHNSSLCSQSSLLRTNRTQTVSFERENCLEGTNLAG